MRRFFKKSLALMMVATMLLPSSVTAKEIAPTVGNKQTETPNGMSYSQSALTSLITVYIPSSSFSKAPKHKCHFQWYYQQLSDGSWMPTHDCLICGDGDF